MTARARAKITGYFWAFLLSGLTAGGAEICLKPQAQSGRGDRRAGRRRGHPDRRSRPTGSPAAAGVIPRAGGRSGTQSAAPGTPRTPGSATASTSRSSGSPALPPRPSRRNGNRSGANDPPLPAGRDSNPAADRGRRACPGPRRYDPSHRCRTAARDRSVAGAGSRQPVARCRRLRGDSSRGRRRTARWPLPATAHPGAARRSGYRLLAGKGRLHPDHGPLAGGRRPRRSGGAGKPGEPLAVFRPSHRTATGRGVRQRHQCGARYARDAFRRQRFPEIRSNEPNALSLQAKAKRPQRRGSAVASRAPPLLKTDRRGNRPVPPRLWRWSSLSPRPARRRGRTRVCTSDPCSTDSRRPATHDKTAGRTCRNRHPSKSKSTTWSSCAWTSWPACSPRARWTAARTPCTTPS